jgi:mono/diheme cytochrome c family protein
MIERGNARGRACAWLGLGALLLTACGRTAEHHGGSPSPSLAAPRPDGQTSPSPTRTPGLDDALTLQLPGAPTRVVTQRSLAELLPGRLRSVTVDSPVYRKRITYRGYRLGDVLSVARPGGVAEGELEFHCEDGFLPVVPASLVDELGLFVAIGEVGLPDGRRWEPPHKGHPETSPAPYYIIGTTTGSYNRFPWPYQVTKIQGVDFRKTYPDAYPTGAAPDSATWRGFDRFRTTCMGCHSVNLQGGDVGPELNVPRNITEYRDRATLIAFIQQPSAFRSRSKMPTLGLKEPEIQELVAYLTHMKGLKKPAGATDSAP